MGFRLAGLQQGFAGDGIAGKELLQQVLPFGADLSVGYGDGTRRAAADFCCVKTEPYLS